MTRIIPYELIKHLEWTPDQEVPSQPEPVQLKPTEQIVFSIDHLINNGNEFYNTNLPTALEEAINSIGKNGVIASMPYLIAGKAQADKENYLWKSWFTALSEENIGVDKEGRFVESGKPVVVTVHGGGILTSDRIQKAYDEGLTEQRAAKLTEDEFSNLLNGTLPNGENINIYTIDDVQNNNISHLFGKYAVVLDFESAKSTKSGYHQKEDFMKNPLVLARVGTPDYLEDYFEKAKHSSDQDVRNSHIFEEIDTNQQQGRLLYLGDDYDGLSGHDNLDNCGRFVGVAPEAQDA